MRDIWKSKKVIVCGASGFIGSNMVSLLLEKGADVTAVVSPKKGANKLLKANKKIEKKIKVIKADLSDPASCNRILKNQDTLLNFAAIDGGTNFKRQYPVEIYNANTGIVKNLLDASVKNKLKKVLLMSSSEVYSPELKGFIKEEDGFTGLPAEVTAGYAWSKRATETLAKLYADEFGLKIAIARPSNVYGPSDYADSEKGRVIPIFIKQARNGEDITIWGNGLTKKSFLYVEDLNITLLNLVSEYAVCDPVNIASEKQISIKKLAQTIIKLTGSRSKIKFIAMPEMKTDKRIISIQKAKKVLGFKEKFSLEQGLSEVIHSEQR